ncbi:MAG: FHA domain-containing protein [Anaerolineae bacterium]|nr:FHA domain-containing protein [Anaerolineae bacterium]
MITSWKPIVKKSFSILLAFGLLAVDFLPATAVGKAQDGDDVVITPPSAEINLKSGEFQEVYFVVDTPEIPLPKMDILFLFDVTSSMGEVLGQAKENGIQIMEALKSVIPDAAFGVASFADFNITAAYGGENVQYGKGIDYPWRLEQDIGQDIGAAAEAINRLGLTDGGDWPEATLTALWQAVGIGWRPGARRAVALFTDAPAHEPEFYLSYGGKDSGIDPGPDGTAGTGDDLRMETLAQTLKGAGVSVFTVYTSPEPSAHVQAGFEYLAEQTGGKVFNLENAADLSRVLAEDLAASVQVIGRLNTQVSVENSEELAAEVTPEDYRGVQGGEQRGFTVQVTAVEKVRHGGQSRVMIDFLADNVRLGTAVIVVDLARSGGGFWWVWLLAAALVVGAYLYFRRWSALGSAVVIDGRNAILIYERNLQKQRKAVWDGFTIGADSACDLTLEDASIKPKHVRLRYANGIWFIQSIGGLEDFSLNGKPSAASQLQNGTIIDLGRARLEFRTAGKMDLSKSLKAWYAGLAKWFNGLGKWRWALAAAVAMAILILACPKENERAPSPPPEKYIAPPVEAVTTAPKAEGATGAYSGIESLINSCTGVWSVEISKIRVNPDASGAFDYRPFWESLLVTGRIPNGTPYGKYAESVGGLRFHGLEHLNPSISADGVLYNPTPTGNEFYFIYLPAQCGQQELTPPPEELTNALPEVLTFRYIKTLSQSEADALIQWMEGAASTDTYDPSVNGPITNQIAFVHHGGPSDSIFIMNADGSNRRMVLGSDEASYFYPVWSPDGNQLAFTYSKTSAPYRDILALTGFKTGESKLLHLTTNYHVEKPFWSPDGKKIAFIHFFEQYRGQVQIYDLQKNTLTPIGPDTLWSSNLSWGPGSDWLAVEIVRDGINNLLLLSTDGMQSEILDMNYHATRPAWSPVDETILYQRNLIGDELFLEKFQRLNSESASLGGSSELCGNIGQPTQPVWSPNGKFVAYSCFSSLWVLDFQTLETRKIFQFSNPAGVGITDLGGISWSPNGEWLLFHAFESEKAHLFKGKSDGSEVLRLSPEDSNDLHPTWQP